MSLRKVQVMLNLNARSLRPIADRHVLLPKGKHIRGRLPLLPSEKQPRGTDVSAFFYFSDNMGSGVQRCVAQCCTLT